MSEENICIGRHIHKSRQEADECGQQMATGLRNKIISSLHSEIVLGDCLEVIKTLPDESINLVVTDPPYGISWQSKWYKSDAFEVMAGDGDLNWLSIVPDMYRVMKRDSSLYVFASHRKVDEVKAAFDKHFNFKNMLAIKKRHFSGLGDLSSYANGFEIALYYTKGSVKFEKVNVKPVAQSHLKDTRHANKSFVHRPTSWIDWIPSSPYNIDIVHPTEKNVRLISLFIELNSREGDVVLDPFLGSGTTAVAREMLRRRWIGIELSKEYCETARGRVAKWVSQSRLDKVWDNGD